MNNGFKPQKASWTGMNEVNNQKDYYMSYDHISRTTAICGNKATFFLTLDGDHRNGLDAASKIGKDAVIMYFCDNINNASEHSEHKWCAGMAKADPLETHRAFCSVFQDQLDMLKNAISNMS